MTIFRNKKIGITIGFKGKDQLPLIMFVKEFYDKNGGVYWAKCLLSIYYPGQRKKLIKKGYAGLL